MVLKLAVLFNTVKAEYSCSRNKTNKRHPRESFPDYYNLNLYKSKFKCYLPHISSETILLNSYSATSTSSDYWDLSRVIKFKKIKMIFAGTV